MAVTIEFRLSDGDFNKLRFLKRAERCSELTFNDYAEEILSSALIRMYREYDRQGLIKENADE